MPTGRARWFADVLNAGLETKTLNEQEILAHVTPGVLASSMPKDVMVRVFDAALTSGSVSPSALLKTVSPELIAEHVPQNVVWACITSASERSGIPESAGGKPKDDVGAREFLRRSLASALSNGVMTAKDVVEHVNASVLGHLPDALTTKLLEASLAAGKMSPEIIVEVLGTEAIAKHAPTAVVWSCIAKVAGGAAAGSAVPTPIPEVKTITADPPPPRPGTLEILDDDVASVLVDLEDSGGLDPKVIEAKTEDTKSRNKSQTKRP
jgi:hypothetical protein